MAYGANFKLKFCTYPIHPFKYPNLIEAIIEDDSVEWTDEDLAKLTNGNIIRVFRDEHGVIKYFLSAYPRMNLGNVLNSVMERL